MNLDIIRESIKREEGLSLTPYQCSKGHLTIGYGHKLTDGATSTPITQEVAEWLFEADLRDAIVAAQDWCEKETWEKLTDARQHCLIDMHFNMGAGAMKGFIRTRWAIQNGYWRLAAGYLMQSKYARQVPNRAQRNQLRILTGVEPE